MKNPEVVLPGAMQPIQDLLRLASATGVPELTLRLLQLRVSQINGCGDSVETGMAAARMVGETQERLTALALWQAAPHFAEAERVVLELAECATRLADSADPIPDDVWRRAAWHYNEKQLAAIVLMIAATNLCNRLDVATRRSPAPGAASLSRTDPDRVGRVTGIYGEHYELRPIGRVESPLRERAEAPRQGDEGAPDVWIAFAPEVRDALSDLAVGQEVLLLTWLDRAERDSLKVHPRGEDSRPDTGVFSTRSPDRPNPIGLHRVEILAMDGLRVRVRNLEALDGTPVVDVKPLLGDVADR
jgi:tRNA-Thr(GGU) m(6)t(6)A37 methyltransferase TsaA